MSDDPRIQELARSLNALRGQVDDHERQISAMDDDIPEGGGRRSSEEGWLAVWSGRVVANDGTLIAEWDVTDPENITGEYIRYDGVAGTAAFTDDADESFLCWHVADAAVAPATGYVLSTDTAGDIVLPVPKEWEELNVLLTDEDGIQRFKELKIKTEDPNVGFVFARPDSQEDHDDPQLVQMKVAEEAEDGQVLVSDGAGGASWVTPSIKLEIVGSNGIKAILVLGEKEYESQVLYGDTCGDD